MELKKLNKASKIFDRIKELDKEIIELDKLAIVAINDKTEIKLNLTIENITKKENDENKVSFDEDGSLVFGRSVGRISGLYGFWEQRMNELSSEIKQPKNTTELKNKLNSRDFLLVIKVLLESKNEERNSLFKQLSDLGVRF